MKSTLHIKTPKWAEPLLTPSRYKAVYGGRGSGKSYFFADQVIEEHLLNPNSKSLCVREFQSSLDKSVKPLIEERIEYYGVGSYFTVQQNRIKNRHGRGVVDFQGMSTQTEESIKSFQGYDRAWVEEAQTMSFNSLSLLRPTIRKDKDKKNAASEIWFSWNPKFDTDAVDAFFRRKTPPEDSIVLKANFWDNPWFPKVLQKEMEHDRKIDYGNYLWVWEGEYKSNSEARVFSNWRVEEFDTPEDAFFRFGADWGFSIDPTVLVRCYTVGRKLYVDHVAYRVNCDIIDTPDLFLTVPESEKWPIIADRNRPETISHMRKNGFPRMMEANQGRGSVEDGVNFLKGYEIIIHPRCEPVIDEFKNYCYKVDPDTEEVTNVLKDKKNHVIDALRYACESVRRLKPKEQIKFNPIPILNHW